MCRLALYEQSDPYSPEYDAEMTNFCIKAGEIDRAAAEDKAYIENFKKAIFENH